MKTHINYSDKDIFLVNDIVKIWKKKGFVGTLDEGNSSKGFVDISTDDWTQPGTREVIFRLHKIYTGSGLFGEKCIWVTELFTKAGGQITKHGCVEAKNQLKALDRGINQVGFGFSSKTKIEDYYLA